MRERRCVVQIQCAIKIWLARRDKAARVIQKASKSWKSIIERNKHARSAVIIQVMLDFIALGLLWDFSTDMAWK